MKKLSLYVFAMALALGIAASFLTGAVTSGTQTAAAQVNSATNAAFRDGLYLGKLDAGRGNRPHLGSGRWNQDADRRNYIEGYVRGFNEAAIASGNSGNRMQTAEMIGYRDGVIDATSDRNTGKGFQLSKNDNYRTALRGVAQPEVDQERSRHAYRQGYANGYQEAYYGKKHLERAVTGELSSSL